MNIDMKLSKSATSIFEVVTSYHINYAYVNLYHIVRARSGRNGDISEMDIYMGVLTEASQNYCLKNGYYKNVTGLHQYFCKHTKFSNISFKDFIDKIIKELVPEEYFEQLSAAQRHQIVASVLKNTMRNFVNNIINNDRVNLFLNGRINDDHIALLKNIYLSIIINERQNVYKKFVAPGIVHDNTAEISAKIYELKRDLEMSKHELRKKDKMIDLLKMKLGEMITAYKSVQDFNNHMKERLKLMELNRSQYQNPPSNDIRDPSNNDIRNPSNNDDPPVTANFHHINKQLSQSRADTRSDDNIETSLDDFERLNSSDNSNDDNESIEELDSENSIDDVVRQNTVNEQRMQKESSLEKRYNNEHNDLSGIDNISIDSLFN
jgi:hypothetical protein